MNNTQVFKKYTSVHPGSELLQKWYHMTPEDNVGCAICDTKDYKIWYELGLSKAVVCVKCGLKYITPRLSRRQLRQSYSEMFYKDEVFTKDFEGRKHDFYDPVDRKNKIKDRHYEIELTNCLTQNGSILDIGCGTGLYFEGLKGNFKLFGIELSQRAAEYTKKEFGACVNMCEIEEVDYKKDFFDVINMTYVIEHVSNPKGIINKIYRWLKPGGMLLVSSPNWGSIASRFYGEFFRLNLPHQHILLWEEKTLKMFLNEAGFEVNNIYFPYFKTEYFNLYELKRLFRNSFYRILLPFFLKTGYYPPLEKVLSPPFWGNIMVFECYKRCRT
jgi:2-polyprenyl-3-methyl-5-hydroxy-6-metoxy-1,4-benzoquinol methylase